jgi:hypothetical protein
MDEARSLRIGGWAGITFVVLSLIVLPIAAGGPLPPALGHTGAEYAAWYGAHRTSFLLGNYLGIASFFPGFVMLAVLAARVRRLEGPNGWLGPLVLCTGTFAFAIFACSLCLFQVMPFLIQPGREAAAEAFGTLANLWFALDGLAAAPLILSVGWAARTTGALPGWFGKLCSLSAAIAVVTSLGALTATPSWLAGGGTATVAGFIAYFAWALTLAILLFRLAPAEA